MTGFGRTGPLFACSQVAHAPDIICLSKGLTGGAMPMGITATTQEIYDAFYDDDRTRMLYHGHSYTANATICAAALASLDLLLHADCSASRLRIADAHKQFAATITGHEMVEDIRQTGTILAITLRAGISSYHSNLRDELYQYFISRQILLRPLGNIIYILPPYCITDQELDLVYDAIRSYLQWKSAA
jgi:adenosylmethionine-8-amino-7-oxononanoate aminotransferase